jgi:nitrile hydratase subunit beta
MDAAERRARVAKAWTDPEFKKRGHYPLSMPSAPGRPNVSTRQKLKIGDKVTVRVEHIPGHVRAPGYIRGKTGVVVDVSAAYPFPDAHAHGIHADDEPTYDVRFNAEELWLNSADAAQVHVGVFESYLEKVA